MKYLKKLYSTLTRTALLILGLGGFVGSVQASFDSDFVHKYTELNLGNWGYVNYTFPDSNDQINAFNRSVNINIPIGGSYKVGANFSTRMNLKYGSNVWQWTDNNGVISAKPRSNAFTAGIGWNLGFGRLIAPTDNPYGMWLYESEAGKIVRFYNSFDGEAPVANVFYSHDSQKLRLKVVSSTKMILEFTNGHVHEFRKQEGNWEIFKRSDQFGNYQLFTYRYDLNRVTTSDNHGRVQWINFKSDPSGYFPRIIDKVRVTKPASGVAVHTFNYSTLSVNTPGEDNDSATPSAISVPILTSITHPHGDVETFSYYGNSNVGAARLKDYTNRFGGRIRYVYANINMPLVQNPANLNQSLDHFAADVVGVTLRRTVDDVAGGITGNWTFSTQWKDGARNAAPSLSQPSTMINHMDRPDGIKERRYFRIPVKDVAVVSPEVHTVDKSEYGYPGRVVDLKISLDSLVSGSINNLYKHSQPVYRCVNCLDPDPQIINTKRAEIGGYTKRYTVYSNTDWAGRAATIQLKDNLTVKRTTTLVRETNKPATGSLWIAKPPTKTTVTEGGYSKITEHCVNSLGQITRQRQLRGTTSGSKDFIQAFTYDASGNRTQISYFGGDSQAVSTGNLCGLGLPAAQFRRYTNYSKGSISGKGYLTSTGAVAYEKFVNTIDGPTGLVLSHSKGDGLYQAYTYNQLNRLTNTTYPAGKGGKTTISYGARSGSTHATRTVTLKTNDGLTTLSQTIEKYDSFGRIIETKKLGPAGWAVTSSTYDGMGRKSTETNERGGVTQYFNRDYKGRVGIKRPPEGSVHDVTYTYGGDKTSTRKVSIAKDLSSNPPVELFRTTTTTHDLFGRDIASTISDQDGFVLNRTTSYDLNNHWVGKTEGSNSVSNLNQYDALGMMTANSYGSSLTYNALGRPLEEYTQYGDKVDLVYDSAGRLTAKNVAGTNYINYAYATANSSGEHNKGKLVSASRINPNVKDISETVTVTDTFEYKGRGGKLSKRRTSISSPGGNFVTSENAVVYNDALQPLSFSSPSCIQSVRVICHSSGTQVDFAYSYNLGHLVSVTADGDSFMSNVQYNAEGDITSYRSGNGLDTELYYSPIVKEPNQIMVRQNGTLLWDSGVATADGGKVVNHYGVSQEVPDDFYQPTSLPTQSTVYPSKYSNSDLKDALGFTTMQQYVSCEGSYPPCYNVNVYDSSNKVVWERHRPYTWPTSAIGLETPSTMAFSDVFGRSSEIKGRSSYVWDSNHFVLSLADTYIDPIFDLDVYLGGSDTSIGHAAWLSSAQRYFHPDFAGSRVGESTPTDVFTPKEVF